MNNGVKQIIYPVNDLEKAKAQFKTLLGKEPYADSAYYVGFKIKDQDIGLDPNGHKHGVTPYYSVDNIQESLKGLLDAGATLLQDVTDVGNGRRIASVKDAQGNIIGLTQDA